MFVDADHTVVVVVVIAVAVVVGSRGRGVVPRQFDLENFEGNDVVIVEQITRRRTQAEVKSPGVEGGG